ncbi:UDP-glucuronosyl/UDP-glucosyltransferase [Macleaya cordata]|uniref:UDP-glucuronosyl/UDP-glucosyltransferase n=1 Tax=Macleaya cordata TaxID=56857 RepID=A0A200PX83_MACCD|nr:UDP-glucuronosyl/UDP-glucosyltransferase [Macleaya cordata]
MDVVNGEITGACHVVAIPYPGRGHVNPMMNLCKLLVSKLGDVIKITFVVTEEWLGFIESAPRPPQIQLRSIPNVIPSELVRALDFAGFIDAVYTNMEAPIEQLLDQMESPATAIIADTYMPLAVSIGNRRNIPVVSLWTMSPSVFSVFYHFDLLTQNLHIPVDLSERGDELIDYIPGISPTCLADMPTIFNGTGQKVLGRVLEAFSLVRKAQCLLLTSFHELDAQVADTLRPILPFPVYSVGPSIPYTTFLHETDQKPSSATANGNSNMVDYFKWLDSQPKSSVLYVSLGSFLSVSKEQMDEILAGLRDSGVRYLLVSRGDASREQEAFGEMSKVVTWCDQLRVLCHSSVGGFWTHCGWNSTLEGVFAGVPMLTFPIFFDQIPNRKQIVDDWKVGMKVKKEVGAEELVKREEIAMIVKRFMDLDGDESKEMRRRASELKESCRQALAKGGSSDTNLNAFIRSILQCHGH